MGRQPRLFRLQLLRPLPGFVIDNTELRSSDHLPLFPWIGAQHTGSLGPARLLAKRLDLKDRHRLLDVGGGSGAYSIAFCAANPHLRATIFDFPETVDTAKLYAREAGLSDRISHLAGNAMKVEWPKGHDVVLMSYIWSAVEEADLAILAKRAAEALRRAGSCSPTTSWSTTCARVRPSPPGIS